MRARREAPDPENRRTGSLASDLPGIKDRRFFAGLLTRIESEIDVNAITGHGIRLWPLLRFQLGSGFKQADVQNPIAQAQTGKPLEQTGGAEERKQTRQRARREEKDRSYDPKAQIENQLVRLQELEQLDFVMFSNIEKYYQPVGERFYAPALDPIYNDLRQRGSACVIGLEPLNLPCVHEPVRLSTAPYMRVSRKLQQEPAPPGLSEAIEEINALLVRLAPDYVLQLDRVVTRINRWRRRIDFFTDILKVLQPRAVFCSSFTGWTPLIWAARNASVPSVDIQHGGQSPYHYLTTHWTKVPPEGYELLPDFFWVWGEGIRQFILPWLPGGASRHVPVVGGNRYLAKAKKEGDAAVELREAAKLFARIEAAPKVVLVTLGYAIEEILPGNLAEAIRLTPSWLWLLRLHPINRGHSAIDEVQAKTLQRGQANVEFEISTRLPLFSLLSRVDAHATAFSTASREALTFNVPSVIVHPIGANYFQDEIENGMFAYADDPQDIVNALSTIAGEQLAASRGPPFIETDDSLVDSALEQILARSPR